MRKKFYKMHGTGNDYIFFDCMCRPLARPGEAAKRLSDRHFSVGGDGIILIEASRVADAKMRIFNADGSEGKMCGNGIRCVAKFLFDGGRVNRREMTIETLSGVKRLWVYPAADGTAGLVRADMGPANFHPSALPVRLAGERVLRRPVRVGGREYAVTCVSMGNPHCVIFAPPPEPFEAVGRAFEQSPLFPEGVNTEFAEIAGENCLRVRVWERGSGETLSCGSGACASVAAAAENGLCRAGEDVRVRLKGGELLVNYTRERAFMTGDAVLAYTGIAEL